MVCRRSTIPVHTEVVSPLECVGRVWGQRGDKSSYQSRRSAKCFSIPTVRPLQRNAARYVSSAPLLFVCSQHCDTPGQATTTTESFRCFHDSQVNWCHMSMTLTKFVRRRSNCILGNTQLNWSRHISTTCISVVLNNFVKKRLTTKSREVNCDLFRLSASSPYNKIGTHLVLIRWITTSF